MQCTSLHRVRYTCYPIVGKALDTLQQATYHLTIVQYEKEPIAAPIAKMIVFRNWLIHHAAKRYGDVEQSSDDVRYKDNQQEQIALNFHQLSLLGYDICNQSIDEDNDGRHTNIEKHKSHFV